MIAITVSPGAVTAAVRPISPWQMALTTSLPAPAIMSKNVPSVGEETTPLERRLVELLHRRELERE
jgi:hypothetical protein